MKTFKNHKIFSAFGWPMLVVVTLAGLNSYASSGSPSKNLTGGQTAVLDWSGWNAGQVLAIDGNAPGKRTLIELAPGKHEIRYGGRVGTSFLLNPRMKDDYEYPALIDMRAGHHYSVRHERTYGYGSYRDFFWIEDFTSGEVVAGSMPPHKKEKEKQSVQARIRRTIEDHFLALLESAECGDPSAQYDLGAYYLAAIRPLDKRDIVGAWVLYSMAASNGHANAEAVASRIYRDLRQEQIVEAETSLAQFKSRPCNRPSASYHPQRAGETP
jgi:hypothetical protein